MNPETNNIHGVNPSLVRYIRKMTSENKVFILSCCTFKLALPNAVSARMSQLARSVWLANVIWQLAMLSTLLMAAVEVM